MEMTAIEVPEDIERRIYCEHEDKYMRFANAGVERMPFDQKIHEPAICTNCGKRWKDSEAARKRWSLNHIRLLKDWQ